MPDDKPNVLVIDDDLNLLRAIAARLEDRFAISACQDFDQALALLDRQEFQVVLADQVMPGMLGTEFFELLRQRHPHPIRVILSAHEDSAHLLQAINRAELHRYVKKPIDFDELAHVLRNAVDLFWLRRENRDLLEQLRQKNQALTQANLDLGREIDKRTAAEQELRASERKLLELLQERETTLAKANLALRETSGQLETFHKANHQAMGKALRQERITRKLLARLSDTTGREFVAQLVVELARSLEARQVWIGKVVGKTHFEVLYHSQGKSGPKGTFPLEGSVVQKTYARGVYVCKSGLAGKFPDDPLLESPECQAYVGFLLHDSAGNTFGLLSATFGQSLDDPFLPEAVMATFAHRAAAELEREGLLEELRQYRQRLELALDAAEQGIWTFDLKERRVNASPKVFLMLGHPPDAFDSSFDNWRRMLHPDDKRTVLQAVEQIGAPGGPSNFSIEFRLRTADGGYRWIFTKGGVTRRSPGGQALEMLGVNIDIHQKKSGELRLQEYQRQFRAIIDNSPSLIYLKDLEGRYMLANETLVRESAAAGSILGRTDSQIYSEDLARQSASFDQKILETGQSHSFELDFEDGRTFLNVKFPLLDQQGRPYALGGIATDITEHKKTLRELERHKNYFESLVQERTKTTRRLNKHLAEKNKELQKTNHLLEARQQEIREQAEVLEAQRDELSRTLEQLKQAQATLVQSEKMVSLGVLTSGIAHEINNPVNYINAGIQGLKRVLDQFKRLLALYEQIRPDNAEQVLEQIAEWKEDIEYDELLQGIDQLSDSIMSGARRTTEIIRSLRTFSHMDDHEMDFADLNENLDSTLVMLRNQYKGRVQIVREYGQLPKVKCFLGQVNQVFMNILANAIQAISGTGMIRISTSTRDGMACVAITDSGAGIPEEIQGRVFEPFFTTKQVGKGTGLGLSISYQIIEKHQGTIRLESTVGRGSTFTISLPLR